MRQNPRKITSVTGDCASPDALPRAADLLAWYDRHHRRLPWRAEAPARADAYAVWLSEIMLQQTTVTAVKPYYESFLARWPTVAALAAAPLAEVMTAWAGLGYYARARNLHRCADEIVRNHGGRFPETEAGLRDLPGVGAYTAAAIAAIAFDRRAVVVDGNVERVMARLFAVTQPLPGSKEILRAHAATLTPDERPGDYAQAVMDLGATVCTPKSPKCMLCPWTGACAARERGLAESLPRKAPKALVPLRHGIAFWMERADGAVCLMRRPPAGLLGGMLALPSTGWRAKAWSRAAAHAVAPLKAHWRPLEGGIHHTFTHFRLDLKIFAAKLTPAQAKRLAEAVWVVPERLSDAGLPSVMRKAALHALKATIE